MLLTSWKSKFKNNCCPVLQTWATHASLIQFFSACLIRQHCENTVDSVVIVKDVL